MMRCCAAFAFTSVLIHQYTELLLSFAKWSTFIWWMGLYYPPGADPSSGPSALQATQGEKFNLEWDKFQKEKETDQLTLKCFSFNITAVMTSTGLLVKVCILLKRLKFDKFLCNFSVCFRCLFACWFFFFKCLQLNTVQTLKISRNSFYLCL